MLVSQSIVHFFLFQCQSIVHFFFSKISATSSITIYSLCFDKKYVGTKQGEDQPIVHPQVSL